VALNYEIYNINSAVNAIPAGLLPVIDKNISG
jgi:hypothetical protein